MIIAYISLGSNLNRPINQIKMALCVLHVLPNTTVLRNSRLYRTKPVGYLDQPDFINAVAALQTTLSARELFTHLQQIERNQGRVRDGQKNRPRTLDLDLLLYGNMTINEPDLIIPHPRMLERAFVLTPLFEIAPDLIFQLEKTQNKK